MTFMNVGFWSMDYQLWSRWNQLLFWALCSIQRSIQHSYAFILISCNRYAFSFVPCGIWRWVIYLGFENQRQLVTKTTPGNQRFLKKSQMCSPARLISRPAFFKASCNRSKLGTPMHVKLSKMIETYSKE
jgi:hypothetical protein